MVVSRSAMMISLVTMMVGEGTLGHILEEVEAVILSSYDD
jgi:hypothetical protein